MTLTDGDQPDSPFAPASDFFNRPFVESFHGRFRDECLNREQLWMLTEARVVIEDFPARLQSSPAA